MSAGGVISSPTAEEWQVEFTKAQPELTRLARYAHIALLLFSSVHVQYAQRLGVTPSHYGTVADAALKHNVHCNLYQVSTAIMASASAAIQSAGCSSLGC
jgi:hypothetical protein